MDDRCTWKTTLLLNLIFALLLFLKVWSSSMTLFMADHATLFLHFCCLMKYLLCLWVINSKQFYCFSEWVSGLFQFWISCCSKSNLHHVYYHLQPEQMAGREIDCIFFLKLPNFALTFQLVVNVTKWKEWKFKK